MSRIYYVALTGCNCNPGTIDSPFRTINHAAQWQCEPVTTQRLGFPRITEEGYENPDGTPVDFVPDLLGKQRGAAVPGPLAELKPGKQTIVVWQ